MDLLDGMLDKSGDFLVVLDSDGNCDRLGAHFVQMITRLKVNPDAVKKQLTCSFQEKGEGVSALGVRLEKLGIYHSPFEVLGQDKRGIVLIARDMTPDYEDAGLLNNESLERFREERKRIHSLLDESSDPVFSFREDGTYLYVNKVFAGTLGYEQEGIIGRKIWDIFPQDEADKRFAVVSNVFETGKAENIEVKIPLPGGDKYFLTTAKPVIAGDNRVDFVICISKDITELRETQKELKNLTGILPICSACKNIRNDRGAWLELEEYIQNHSDALFSHGICPECAKELYPEFYYPTPE